MIYLHLIYNLSMLVALSVLSGFVGQKEKFSDKQKAAAQGIIFGSVAMVGMLYPVNFSHGLIFDGRSVVLSLCALFFGPVSAAISASMTLILRISQGGVGITPGVLVISTSSMIGLVFHYKVYSKNRSINTRHLFLMGLLVHLLMVLLMLTLPSDMAWNVIKKIGLPVMLIYPVATILIGKVISDNLEKSYYLLNLKLSEEKYRVLIENSHDVIYTLSKEGVFTFVSEAWTKLLGHPTEQVLNHPFEPFVHPDDLPACMKFFQSMFTSTPEINVINYRVKHSDGSWRWHSTKAVTLRGEKGNITGFLGIARDITEQKKIELELRKNQKFTSDLIEHSGALVFVKNIEGKYLLINGRWEKATGLKRENVLGKTDHEVFPKETADQFRKNDLEAIDKGETIQIEEVLGDGDDKKYFLSVKFPIKDDYGKITGICGMTTESTEYRLTQVNLNKLAIKHKAILDTVPDIVMEVDNNKVYTWANKSGYEFFGDDVIGKEAASYFVGEQETYKIVKPLFEGKENVIYVESLQRRKDGKVRVLAWWCKVDKDISGNILGGISSARDITEQREYENTIRMKNKELEELNGLMIGRELKMIELKEEINQLLKEMGSKPKY
ncbi:TPA: hypothetical protein DCR49_10375 [Candidatus Delongbacteria bacterium]|nr:hypothetical protein [Candidatus Delongbacteria bacterium]